jgi:nucleoside-triphosphatase
VSPSFNSPGALAASFISPRDIKPGLTLVTGPRDAGKTRWCMELAGRVGAAGMNLRGLVSPAVMEDGEKVGYDLLDLGSGERRRLAYRIGEAEGDLATEHWQMAAETLKWGNEILRGIKDCEIFILDEAGPLEFVKGVGLTAGLNLLDAKREFPCFLAIRPSLIEAACKRWPWAGILELTAEALA